MLCMLKNDLIGKLIELHRAILNTQWYTEFLRCRKLIRLVESIGVSKCKHIQTYSRIFIVNVGNVHLMDIIFNNWYSFIIISYIENSFSSS